MTQTKLVVLILLALPCLVSAQEKNTGNKEYANKILDIQFHYTYEFPGGDLASRFDIIHNVGFGGIFKTKDNWLFSADGSYQFGNYVKSDVAESILFNISNSTGAVSNNSGAPGMLILGERGINAFLKAGKLIPFTSDNLNSGFTVMAGIGFVSHKINISTPQNDIPTMTDDLKKGYDRLTMGWALSQFIGYTFHSKNRRVNFFAGFDLIEAFTQSTRGFNYDQRENDTQKRLDIFFGPRFGWTIPIYLTTKDQDEFYFR
jgi:hypothetical protein